MWKSKLAGVALAVTLLGGPANALSIVFSSEALPGSPAAGETVIENFDDALATGYSWSGLNRTLWSSGGNPTGNLFNEGVTGFAGDMPGNETTFASVFTGGSATLSSANKLQSLSVDIGSIDDYNFISFYNGAELVGEISGTDLATPPNGSWTDDGTNRRFFFVGSLFDSIQFRSNGNSFEFDNIATSEVPEPAMLGLFGLGIMGLAFSRRRRQQQS